MDGAALVDCIPQTTSSAMPPRVARAPAAAKRAMMAAMTRWTRMDGKTKIAKTASSRLVKRRMRNAALEGCVHTAASGSAASQGWQARSRQPHQCWLDVVQLQLESSQPLQAGALLPSLEAC